jgi:hypothetical protein
MTDIGPFQADHTLVPAKLPRQLPIPHINGKYPSCSPLQETIGKPAGGSADVKSAHPFNGNNELVERFPELESATAYKGIPIALQADHCITRYKETRLVGDLLPYHDHTRKYQRPCPFP